MNSLSSLQNNLPQGLRSSDSGMPTSLRKLGEMAGVMSKGLSKAGELVEQRVDALGKATTQMAGDLIAQFAQTMFGEQAKGMTIQLDQMSLSASSSFTVLQASSQSAQGSRQASAFRLSDTSSFVGKGTLTTADGQRFEIEIEVRYESVIEGASIAQQRNINNGEKDIPSANAGMPTHFLDLNTPTSTTATPRKETQKPAPADGFQQDFMGTALDLLQRLSSEPVFRPFALLQADSENQNALQLLGEMSLQLLNLPGGARYLDMSPDFNPDQKSLNTSA